MDRKIIIIILIILIIVAGGSYYYYYYFNKQPKLLTSNNQENKEEFKIEDYNDITTEPYFDISINNNYLGRIIIKLFDDEVPNTCRNFRYLCSVGLLDKSKPSYQDTSFHRVIRDFMIQGGDITNGDGTGGFSMYGEKFDDENFNLDHNQEGLLSMANSGQNTNNSQFFITLKKTPWLDNKHVVFGIIISGFDIVKKIEEVDTGENDKPIENVIISKCGLLRPKKK